MESGSGCAPRHQRRISTIAATPTAINARPRVTRPTGTRIDPPVASTPPIARRIAAVSRSISASQLSSSSAIALRVASARIASGRSSDAGIRVSWTSTGMTRTPRRSASTISLRTWSSGSSRRLVPSDAAADSQRLPMIARNTVQDRMPADIARWKSSPGAIVSRSRKMASRPKCADSASHRRPACPDASSRR